MAKMSVAEAARVFLEEKPEIRKRQARLEAAEDVLKEHFRKTGRHEYRGQIGYAVSTQLRLDTAKVKAELGARLPKFQKSITVEQLSILK